MIFEHETRIHGFSPPDGERPENHGGEITVAESKQVLDKMAGPKGDYQETYVWVNTKALGILLTKPGSWLGSVDD